MAILIQMKLNESLYLRDPQMTDLGRRIIKHSIELIEEIGIEHFTFKKLAERINSTEASIYRYFENKYNLLIYLVSWYWEFMRYLIGVKTTNIEAPETRLRIAIETIVDFALNNPVTDYVDESLLQRIVIIEAPKVYHTREVDTKNKEGFYTNLKELVIHLAAILRDVNPALPYPNAIATLLIETTHSHLYYSRHLPGLTSIEPELEALRTMIEDFAFKLIRPQS